MGYSLSYLDNLLLSSITVGLGGHDLLPVII